MANSEKFKYDELGKVTGDGLDIALFPQIREALANRMKEIFGNDIDLSTASADGQYLNMEALIANNQYKLISYLFDNLNPSTAKGKYLDILCSLTNVKRNKAEYSTAQVLVKYTGNSTISPSVIQAQDRNGVTWTWRNPYDYTGDYTYSFSSGDAPTYLTFTCDITGPVEAYAGTSPYATTDANFWTNTDFENTNGSIYLALLPTFKLYETSNAVLGSDIESDSSLRLRRSIYNAGNSVTTQAGLETAIYNYDGVADVYILNNVTGSDTAPLVDGAVVANHDVYICIRYKENIDTDNVRNELSGIIFNKMTAGVNTSDAGTNDTPPVTITGGTIHESEITLVSGYTTHIYWKECTPVAPTITITFTTFGEYITGTSGTTFSNFEQSIVTTLENYFNNVSIDSEISIAEIQITMMSGDLKPSGNNTFIPVSGNINSNQTYKLPLTYIKYNNSLPSTYVFSYVDNGNGTKTGTLTISN